MNPPYSPGLVGSFVRKLLDEHHAGNVTAALVFTNNSTDTRWWQSLARRSNGCAARRPGPLPGRGRQPGRTATRADGLLPRRRRGSSNGSTSSEWCCDSDHVATRGRRNLEIIHWEDVDATFPRNITPTNVDWQGFVDFAGIQVEIEFKHENTTIEAGQDRAFIQRRRRMLPRLVAARPSPGVSNHIFPPSDITTLKAGRYTEPRMLRRTAGVSWKRSSPRSTAAR